jgi:hypothetical protein
MKRINALKWQYILFLGAITFTVLSSQLLVNYNLQKQNTDAKLINMAGRQRMLGQRLAKLTLYIQNDLHSFGRIKTCQQKTPEPIIA